MDAQKAAEEVIKICDEWVREDPNILEKLRHERNSKECIQRYVWRARNRGIEWTPQEVKDYLDVFIAVLE